MNNESITVPKDFEGITLNPYPKGWKAMQFGCWDRPKGMRQWFNFLWGWDVFYGSFPFTKAILAANILVWIVLIFLGR